MEYPMLTPLYISLLALPPTVACTSGRIVSPKANAMMPADSEEARVQCQAAAVASVPEGPHMSTKCIQEEGDLLEAAAREELSKQAGLTWPALMQAGEVAAACGREVPCPTIWMQQSREGSPSANMILKILSCLSPVTA